MIEKGERNVMNDDKIGDSRMLYKGENENKNKKEKGGRKSIELDKESKSRKKRMKASRFSQHTVQYIAVREEKVRTYKYEDSDVIELLHIMTLCVMWCGVV